MKVDPGDRSRSRTETASLIRWGDRDTEIVRILGIDTPEVRRLEHNLPYDQPFGPEARAFAQGAFAAATEVELLRSPTLDPYGRTLAYLFINGRNYSVLAIKAGYTTETVSHYGDNGLPSESAEVVAAAKAAAPLAVRAAASVSGPDAHPDRTGSRSNGRVSRATERSARGEETPMPIVGLKGERVRLVPPDRTLHLENALVWLNDPEITATLKYNLGVTRRQEELFFEQIETQREQRLHLGDPRRGRAAHRLHRPARDQLAESLGDGRPVHRRAIGLGPRLCHRRRPGPHPVRLRRARPAPDRGPHDEPGDEAGLREVRLSSRRRRAAQVLARRPLARRRPVRDPRAGLVRRDRSRKVRAEARQRPEWRAPRLRPRPSCRCRARPACGPPR